MCTVQNNIYDHIKRFLHNSARNLCMEKILKLHPPASEVSKPPRRCQKEFNNIWMLDVFTFSHIKTYLIIITFEIFQARESTISN
jgi:hypothetical protein